MIEQTLLSHLNDVWLLQAAALVLLMQAGFLLVESGLVRAKNSINVAQKNISDFVLSTLAFALCGFMLMFGLSIDGWVGLDSGLLLLRDLPDGAVAFFAFQVVFCGTAATIVSGAVAERVSVIGYYFLAVIIGLLIYPVFGHWAWGSALNGSNAGFLEAGGFVDVTGATVVHSVGAWIGLAGAVLIGPRIDRYDDQGNPTHIRGHNSMLATLGCLVLWVGWIGFSGGGYGIDNPLLPKAIANTLLAGAAGGAAMMTLGRIRDGLYRPDRIINGVLAGLVAITAHPGAFGLGQAVMVGAIGSVIAMIGRIVLERHLKIDDAIGAIPVHGFSGVWGTLAVALFVPMEYLALGSRWDQLNVQLFGAVVAFAWAFGIGFIAIKFIDLAMLAISGRGMRVSAAREREGLNSTEHGATLGTGMLQRAMLSLLREDSEEKSRVQIEHGDESAELGILFNQILDKLDKEHKDHIKAYEQYADNLQHSIRREKELNALQQRFVSMASHEFRTPLSIIDGAAQRLLRRRSRMGPEEVDKGLTKIRNAVKRMVNLVESTLSASQIEEGRVQYEPQSMSLIEVIEAVCERQCDISPDQEIKLDLQALPNEMYGDPQLITNIFSNLVSNAVKYSPAKRDITVRGWTDNEDLFVSVCDKGLGIPEDELPRMFERFFRARTATGIAGTGIGLNVVKEFADMHGGGVAVESKVGSGSTFTVQLPIKGREAPIQDAGVDDPTIMKQA